MKNKRVMYIKDLFRNVKTGKVYEKSEIFPYKDDLKEFIEEAKRIKFYVNHIVWNDEDDFIYLCENILGLKPHEDINKKDIIHIKQVYCIANDGQEIHEIRDIPLPDREKYLQWVCREYRYNNKTTMMYEGYDTNSYMLSVNCENSNCYAVGNFNGISDKSTIYDLGDIVEFNYGLYDKLFGIITYTYNYSKYYSELESNKEVIFEELKKEKEKFGRTLEKGLKVFEKETANVKEINGDLAFKLYDTYGFPIELTIEEASNRGLEVDTKGFDEKFKAHQELSRTASKGMFKGGLAGDSEKETRYHTATHLLNAALKVVVSPNCHQMGSNITDERMRFDFTCDHKLTDEEKQKTEDLVNKWILDALDVTVEEMPKEKAVELGAEAMFIERYPDIVTVYSVGSVSKEICMGPHVKNSKEVGKFKIVKEEASSAGVRRIKAVIED